MSHRSLGEQGYPARGAPGHISVPGSLPTTSSTPAQLIGGLVGSVGSVGLGGSLDLRRLYERGGGGGRLPHPSPSHAQPSSMAVPPSSSVEPSLLSDFDDGDDDFSSSQVPTLQYRTMSEALMADPDLDSPIGHDTALEMPHFHTGAADVADEDDERSPRHAGDQPDSDHAWSDSDTESDESTSASENTWYGHGRLPTSHSSSVASRMVNLDEEISAHEQTAEDARHAAKAEATRKKLQQEQNGRMPCPPMCGVSWGINGQLVYFSNIPLLTHYLVTNHRRRQKPAVSSSHESAASTSDEHRLMQSGSLGEPSAHIDHDEEEQSAWAGASAHAQTAAVTSSSYSPALVDVDEVLPRTYQDLLQLPYVAAHLGYVVGDELEDRVDESDVPTPMVTSPATGLHSGTSSALKWPQEREAKQQRHGALVTSPDDATNGKFNGGATAPVTPSPPQALTSASSSVTADSTPVSAPAPSPSSSDSALDLARVDLADRGTTGIGASPSPAHKVSLPPITVPSDLPSAAAITASSSTDSLSDPFELIEDDFDVELLGGSSLSGGSGGGANGTDDFFSSFYNSTLQLGVAAVATPAASKTANERPNDAAAGSRGPLVPPLPSSSHEKQRQLGEVTTLDAVTLTPSQSTNAVSDAPTMLSSPTEVESSSHSWSALSHNAASMAGDAFPRRRVRINTAILMMDCQDILPCSPLLAHEYTLSGDDSVSVCLANQAVCERAGRFDLASTWQLAAIIAQPHVQPAQPSLTPWNEHPMGGRLAEQLIHQYLRVGDIQTVAMLVSVFSFRTSPSSHSSPLLPSRPPPTLVEVHDMDGGALAPAMSDRSASSISIASTATNTTTAAAEVPPIADVPSPHVNLMMPAHPMAMLPPTADGSARTWGPGSASKGAVIARGFAAAAAAIRSNSSSGNASPGDTIYNINSTQRSKWRLTSSEDGASMTHANSHARIRSGSLASARDSIPRIDEGGDHHSELSHLTASDSLASVASADGLTPSPSTALLAAASSVHQLRLDAMDLYLYLYAEYLYRIGEYSTRAKLLKFLRDTQPTVQQCITGFAVDEQVYGLSAVCAHCDTEQTTRTRVQPSQVNSRPGSSNDLAVLPTSPSTASLTPSTASSTSAAALPISPRCNSCHHFPLTCALCHVSVKGIYLMCVLCGHGGHPAHITGWFRDSAAECPTACGCRCESDGGLHLSDELADGVAHDQSTKQSRRKKKDHQRSIDAARAAVDAQLIDADEDMQAADDAEHSEQLQHFYNPTAF